MRQIVPLSRLGLAVLALCAAAPAPAQVTLGGVADGAVRHVNNDGSDSVRSLVSGSNATSRLIFRGTEDLGGGLGAGFWLEHGFALDTGTSISSAQFFDRRATVSLTHRGAGELRAGRDFVPSYLGWNRYDPFGYIGVAGSNNLVSAGQTGPIRSAFSTSPNTTVRSSNSLQWLLPSGWAGLDGGVMVADSEGGSAATGDHRLVGGRLGWSTKGFGVSAAMTRSRNNLTAAAGGRFTDKVVGGFVDVAGLRLSAAVRVFEQAAARQRNAIVALAMPIGASEIKASVVQADFDGRVGNAVIDANGARQFGLGYVYNLSKRSALYATAAVLDNQGASTFVIPGGGALRPGGTSRGVEFGMRHAF